MMYYTGTKAALEAYLAEVNEGENYTGGTTTWADILKHHSKRQYVVLAHPNYPSKLNTLNKLPEDWYSNEVI